MIICRTASHPMRLAIATSRIARHIRRVFIYSFSDTSVALPPWRVVSMLTTFSVAKRYR